MSYNVFKMQEYNRKYFHAPSDQIFIMATFPLAHVLFLANGIPFSRIVALTNAPIADEMFMPIELQIASNKLLSKSSIFAEVAKKLKKNLPI